MAPLLAMANMIRFIRPNEADTMRVQDAVGRHRWLHVKLMHHVAHRILLLFSFGAVHEVLTSKPPQPKGLLMLITVSRKIIAETDHLGTIVGSSTTVYTFHRFDENTFTNMLTFLIISPFYS